MTREVPLSKGYVALVDDIDFWFIQSRGPWHVGNTNRPTIHAKHTIRRSDGSHSALFMHQLLLPGAALIDHINGDGLDNRRANLRAATPGQNAANRRVRTDSASGLRGVCRRPAGFQARIQDRTIGTFPTADLAARAYDQAALATYGEFARTNFPREDYAA